jgi:hypothetical protein
MSSYGTPLLVSFSWGERFYVIVIKFSFYIYTTNLPVMACACNVSSQGTWSRWFSGITLACHAGDGGSIPPRDIFASRPVLALQLRRHIVVKST